MYANLKINVSLYNRIIKFRAVLLRAIVYFLFDSLSAGERNVTNNMTHEQVLYFRD